MNASWRAARLTTCGAAILLIGFAAALVPSPAFGQQQKTPSQRPSESVGAMRRAAEQGNMEAQTILASIYAQGRGVPQDDSEAARWYRKAADQGYLGAQVLLGTLYQEGHGVPQDYVQAHMWMNLAASRASADDQQEYSSMRDYVAGKMTAQQIAEAQRLAREWKSKNDGQH